jgi:hypothetical protein
MSIVDLLVPQLLGGSQSSRAEHAAQYLFAYLGIGAMSLIANWA